MGKAKQHEGILAHVPGFLSQDKLGVAWLSSMVQLLKRRNAILDFDAVPCLLCAMVSYSKPRPVTDMRQVRWFVSGSLISRLICVMLAWFLVYNMRQN